MVFEPVAPVGVDTRYRPQKWLFGNWVAVGVFFTAFGMIMQSKPVVATPAAP